MQQWNDILNKELEIGDARGELARYAINNGADVNLRRNDGKTLLHLAAHKGNLALTEYLCSNGAVAHQDVLGRTPIHEAAAGRAVGVLRFLLRQLPTIVNQADNDRKTPWA